MVNLTNFIGGETFLGFALQSFSLGTCGGISVLAQFNGHELQAFGACKIEKIIQVKAYLVGPFKSQAGVGEKGVIKTLDSAVTESPFSY